MSCIVNIKHLMQLEPLPVYLVLFWDEIGDTLAKMGFTQVEITQFIEEVFRYPRHYNEMRIIMTEQEGNNVLNVTRKNIAFMDYFTKPQQKVMTPLLFKLIHRFIDWLLKICNYNIDLWGLDCIYRWAKDLEKNIGFRKFSLMQIGNQEQAGAGKILSKIRPRYAYATLNGEYDDRSHREGYKAKEKPVTGTIWKKLWLSLQEIEEHRELRENLLSKPSVELRQELGLKLTNFEILSMEMSGLDIDIDKVNEWIKKLFNKKKSIPINKLTEQQFSQLLEQVSKYRSVYERIQVALSGTDETMSHIYQLLQKKLNTKKDVELLEVPDAVLTSMFTWLTSLKST